MIQPREHGPRDAHRLRRAAIAGLLVTSAAIVLSGALVAQSPPAATPSTQPSAVGVPSPFPSAEEVGEVLGVSVELRGIEPGLSQWWEGIEFDWQELPGAHIGTYLAPQDEPQAPLVGVTIDVARFATVDDAERHVDDAMFADYPAGFEIAVGGDYVVTHTFTSDDGFGGSFIFLRDGSVVVLVTAMASDGTEMEAASEAIIELVLGRLHGGT